MAHKHQVGNFKFTASKCVSLHFIFGSSKVVPQTSGLTFKRCDFNMTLPAGLNSHRISKLTIINFQIELQHTRAQVFQKHVNTFTFLTKNKQRQERPLTWHTVGHTVHPAGITELYECSDSVCSAERPHTANSREGKPRTHRSADWQRNPLDTLTHMFAVWSETTLEEEERVNSVTAQELDMLWCKHENTRLMLQVWQHTNT